MVAFNVATQKPPSLPPRAPAQVRVGRFVVITCSVPNHSCDFYNADSPTDAQLVSSSRDPIAYRGSEWNLNEFLESHPPRGVDPLGLEYTEQVIWDTYQNLKPELPAGFDAVTYYDPPRISGNHQILAYAKGRCCHCAIVISAATIYVHAVTLMPTNPPFTTAAGVAALAGHEGRRRQTIRMGDAAYFAPASGAGGLATASGAVCRITRQNAINVQIMYLNALQRMAIDDFNAYVRIASADVSKDNLRKNQNRVAGPGGTSLFDSYKTIHNPPPAPKGRTPVFPKSSCDSPLLDHLYTW